MRFEGQTTARRRVAAALGLTALALAGCGEPLASGGYRGEPLFEVRGFIGRFTTIPRELLDHPKRISLFWSPSADAGWSSGRLMEQAEVSVAVEALSNFTLTLYHPPEEAALLDRDPALGVALLLVYVDVDGDGAWRPERGDVLIGGATDQVLLYAPASIPAERSLTGAAVPEGFYLVETPLLCQEPQADAPCDDALAAPLGRACDSDAACGPAGLCLDGLLEPTDAGSCLLIADGLGCTPEGGRLVTFAGLWAPACREQRDCDAFPEHTCNTAQGYCARTGGAALCEPGRAEPGRACATDGDCGEAGECLLEDLDRVYSGGYCVYDADALGCLPEQGVALCDDRCDLDLPEEELFACFEQSCDGEDDALLWFRGCQADADCREGYWCDPFTLACSAFPEVELIIATDFSIEEDVFELCEGLGDLE